MRPADEPLLKWLADLQDAAEERAKAWGHDVPPTGTPAPGEDAVRAVIRDAFLRIGRNSELIRATMHTNPLVAPRPRDGASCTCQSGRQNPGPNHAKDCPLHRDG